METPERHRQHRGEYYPADLQEQAKEAYSQLPESGTVDQLVDQIVAELPTRTNKDGHSYVAANAYVLVGWINDILTKPLGQETRLVVNVGTMQRFYKDPKSVVVCPNGRYISRRNSSSTWLTISDKQAEDYRGLRWEIVDLRPTS